jgi:hypothetical protein
MQRWEYMEYPPTIATPRYLHHQGPTDRQVKAAREAWMKGLNELGAQGWEVITPLSFVVPGSDRTSDSLLLMRHLE